MLIDNCQFLSAEESLNVTDRRSIALNATANDVKLRHNRAVRFLHFALLGGTNNLILGNHFFQGDSIPQGLRTAGLILTRTYNSSTIAENYIDNFYFEWTNERDAAPTYTSGYSFSALSITDNIFYCSEAAPWFSFIVIRPHGPGHFLNGFIATGNKFRSSSGRINRVDLVDTTFAGLNNDAHVNVVFASNTFNGVDYKAQNPLRVKHKQNSASAFWGVLSEGRLPFLTKARGCDAVTTIGPLYTVFGTVSFANPFVELEQGFGARDVVLRWPHELNGEVTAILRMDS